MEFCQSEKVGTLRLLLILMALKTNFIIEVLKNRMVNLFQTSSSYSYDHCLQFAL